MAVEVKYNPNDTLIVNNHQCFMPFVQLNYADANCAEVSFMSKILLVAHAFVYY